MNQVNEEPLLKLLELVFLNEFGLRVLKFKIAEGLFKNSMKVETSQGRFFLKMLNNVPQDKSGLIFLENKYALTELYERLGIGVLTPLKTNSGKYFVSTPNFYCEVYPFLENFERLQDETEIMNLVVQIHSISPDRDYSNHPNTSLNRIQNVLNNSDLRGCEQYMQELYDYEFRNDKFLLHGDLHPGNILRIEGNATVTDFDICCYATKLYDIGKILSNRPFFVSEVMDI
ncbi:phosphotransferase, partial [Candidatus Woesearchaeota archaeon]|nr:phosphotransferase [Candidatus Woesearchaeota archaeon]